MSFPILAGAPAFYCKVWPNYSVCGATLGFAQPHPLDFSLEGRRALQGTYGAILLPDGPASAPPDLRVRLSLDAARVLLKAFDVEVASAAGLRAMHELRDAVRRAS